ncbi:MAG: ParA family protein [Chloroflexota bacterium]
MLRPGVMMGYTHASTWNSLWSIMILAVATQKGGSAKTTTVVNLGAALAERGKRVLIVDLDPQAHATYWLLGPDGRRWGPFVQEWLEAADLNPVRPSGWPGLDIVPANQELSRIRERWDPLNRPTDARQLQSRLTPMLPDYDWILLDCPASFDALTQAALLGADGVIVPVGPPEPLAVDGLHHMLSAIRRLQDDQNPRLRLLGVLISNVRLEYGIQRRALEHLEQARLPLFSTMIASSARIGAAAEQHRPILSTAPRSFVSDSYRVLSLEVEKRARGWLWNWVAGTAGA